MVPEFNIPFRGHFSHHPIYTLTIIDYNILSEFSYLECPQVPLQYLAIVPEYIRGVFF